MTLDLRAKRIAARFSEPRRESSRVACIIAVGKWDGKQSLLKNRDRNYEPKVRIVRKLLDEIEVCYMTDEVTGWCEGLNEYGIGVVNSALAVGRDEAEKKLVSQGKKSKDGERILRALTCKTLDEATDSAKTYHGGIKGHTFISDPKKAVALEQTSKHECFVSKIKPGTVQVRTNHGIEYEDAGYTEGKKYISSVLRRQQALKILKGIEEPSEAATSLMSGRKDDKKDPNNVVRDTKEMSTTSQMVLDLTDLKLQFFEIPGKSEYLGLDNQLPEGYEPKISVEVFRYSTDGEEITKIDPESLEEEGSPSKVAKRFASKVVPLFSYGSNGPEHLSKTLGRPMRTEGAFLEGAKRKYVGYSERWKGGVATLAPQPDQRVLGLVAWVTQDDLDRLDRIEGIRQHEYTRIEVRATLKDGEELNAYAYVATSETPYPPSPMYLDEVRANIYSHWGAAASLGEV